MSFFKKPNYLKMLAKNLVKNDQDPPVINKVAFFKVSIFTKHTNQTMPNFTVQTLFHKLVFYAFELLVIFRKKGNVFENRLLTTK